MPTTSREILSLVIVAVLLCGGLVWMAGQFPKSHHSHVQKSAPTTAAASTAAQQSSTPIAAASPAPQQPHLAPPGVLFSIEYVSSTTKDGVIAFLPGRPLQVLEDKGDTIVVSDGKKKGELPADKLTNDLDIAALAAQQDAEGQQVLGDYLRNQQATGRAFVAQQYAVLDRDLRQIEANKAANYVPLGVLVALDRGPWHERGSLSVGRWIYNPEYPESRSPPSNVYYGWGWGRDN